MGMGCCWWAGRGLFGGLGWFVMIEKEEVEEEMEEEEEADAGAGAS